MKIIELRVNGINNPVGFSYPWVKISWKVEDFTDKKQENVQIEVSADKEFTDIVANKAGKNLSSIGEKIQLELKPYTRYFYRVTVTGDKGETAVSPWGNGKETELSYFETGKMREQWEADYIGTEEADTFHPIFIKKFQWDMSQKIRQARIYVTGLGLYEAYLNGKK